VFFAGFIMSLLHRDEPPEAESTARTSALGRREDGVEAQVERRVERQLGDGAAGDVVGVEDEEGARLAVGVEALADDDAGAVVAGVVRIASEGRLAS
jgi:hypothetical protein